ncbi:UbiH/UbiF/VisC/COQ6 family ubiquinone biosynthesis hydroxylase [Roseomonas marmotae]|uniref:UbiH/UbiF/VisC/COQ6 family ubiquinone biosynthesis hydroxylase n=1 Tax=Roseomonas marmotae TaxID=2768161 RepID=A0ABS3KBU8_9PROT|nr:UbiH/UbiF/VisC/COQ6 family ubiquinone biosynthesis hydroxylase [Roseomonas marmotae]MBO1074953.1 UbiH/UbiF/VisC/COQ6 family ubiquinone biosynthesis hydroxylase [Roseomonas marmotae]QTI80006.1 UbiH/UbiF/VisC/COQ6 family ubiquinone biosynthesis hydroxylase [Roseomonas marmotae]
MSEEIEVCIVGAGPVGATLAATLASAGVSVAVVDAAPLPPMEHPAFDGRAYAIAATSRNLLEAAGVWQHLPSIPGPIRRIRVLDGAPGEPASPLGLDFDSAETGDEPFGWMVEARWLRVALNARLAELAHLQLHAPARAEVLRDEAGATIRLSTGPEFRARLVVGAEGRNSPLRRQAGIGATRFDYHQMGIVGAIAHELPHDEVALEKFLPHGPFAQLPMAATEEYPHVSAIVWTEKRHLAERFLALPDEAYGREIERRMGGHLGRVTPIGRRWSYPLAALHATRYADTRLALVGDAAHGIHPIAGQGLNLGFRDVAALAELVVEAVAANQDPGGAGLLARYQAARRPDALLMLGATHALERLFGNSLPPVRLARRLGLAAVQRMPALKRAFARRAMGFGSATGGLLDGRGLVSLR